MFNIKYIYSKIVKKIRLTAVLDSHIDPTSKLESGTSFVQSKIGRHSFCGYDCDIYCADIGNFTSIASGVVIGGARHPMEWVGMSPVFYKGRDSIKEKFSEFALPPSRRVKVGSDVWIGRNAILLSGVNIGDGAVVGAGSVVTKDVPPYGIVGGNPARLIRFRFKENMITDILKKKWWDMDDEAISEAAHLCRDPEAFINKLNK